MWKKYGRNTAEIWQKCSRRKDMAGICTAAGILCLGYYFVLVIYAGITADFSWFWLMAGVVLEGIGMLCRYGNHHPGFFPGWLKYAGLFAAAAGCILFLGIGAKVIQGMASQGREHLDYVIVLGAQVKKDVPSRALRKRLEKALEYAIDNEHTKLILSGGQGSGEDITEAECMRQYLEEHGVSKERLILEERSTNTMENLKYSNEITKCAAAQTGILSNNFHVYRAVRLAQKQGYEYPVGIAAQSDPIMQPHYVVREIFALVKEKIKGHI